jgi:hypothetical protein
MKLQAARPYQIRFVVDHVGLVFATVGSGTASVANLLLPEEGLGGGCGAVWMNCKDYGICKGLVSKNASNNIMSNLPSISSCRNRNIASINFRMELVFERRALRRICII